MPKKAKPKCMWSAWLYDQKMYDGKGGWFRVCSLCGKLETKKK